MEDKYIIELKGISKVYPGTSTPAVEDFNLKIKEGEFVTLLGPSGCGKSTTLRMIAGFEMPSKGEMFLNGKEISKLPPYKRPVNTVFQRYALFPYLDVYDNVAFGLKLKKIPYEKVLKNGQVKHTARKLKASEIDEKVAHALKIVDLDELEDRDISTLSGGQQQRVAIARAIVNEPKILLLDEPLGALDLKMRKEMQIELKEMHKKIGITFIYVTHDQEEALTMSDTIVVMNDGEIQQVGSPLDVYNDPLNAFVANFIGESNIFNATLVEPKKVKFLGKVFNYLDDQIKYNPTSLVDNRVDVVIRPEDVIIGESRNDRLNGVIQTKIFKGVHYEYIVMVGKNEFVCQDTRDFKVGKKVSLSIKKSNIHIMKKNFAINAYYDAWIDKNNKLMIGDDAFDCNIVSLIPGSKLDEDGYLIDKEGRKYDLNDADVHAEIALSDIELIDNIEEAEASGSIISIIYKGDHYQIVIRTKSEEDFVVDTEYSYNENDQIGFRIDPKKIKMRLKGDPSKYEI